MKRVVRRFYSYIQVVTLSLFIQLANISVANAGPSQCGPVINGSILNFSFECLNDMTMLATTSNNFNWQYVQDSLKDGLVGSTFGGKFEIHGIAFKESSEEVFVVIKAELDEVGMTIEGVLVTYGDLFLNFSGLDFKSASDQAKLYAIKFSQNNDSGAADVGLYKDVKAKSVSATNLGYSTLQLYEDKVNSLAGVVGYGSFDSTQTYYAKDISSNVIDSGTFLGNITMLNPADLLAAGYDASIIGGATTIAFKFQKSLIIDQCGVIGGNGTSCLDCAGTPCGTAKPDICGVCNGNGTSCLDCAGVPNGNTVVDQCGVCGGNGTSCLDCAGTANGNKVVDQCGVCGGDGSSCLDCAGTVNGTATVDQCGVCGGNGTSCLDCAGTVNGTAQLDRCGVCNGDGQSCLGCSQVDANDTIIVIDNSVREQKVALATLSRQIKRLKSVNPNLKKLATTSLTEGNKLYLSIWQSVWSLPATINICSNLQFCELVSNNQDKLSQYKTSIKQIHDLSLTLLKKTRRALKNNRFGKKLETKIRSDYDLSLKAVENYPATISSCS